MTNNSFREKGKPLAVDPEAKTASPGAPAFVSRPKGAPVYYGFPVLDDVAADGFKLGMITDFEAEPCDDGDSFVVAPDGSRAGLVWTISKEPAFSEVCPIEPDRWGVWAVNLPFAMTSRENARKNLQSILPSLREKWLAWVALEKDLLQPPG
jgi:hypothetical protein